MSILAAASSDPASHRLTYLQQSEIVAQRLSTMYEASISFLRRSVMPELLDVPASDPNLPPGSPDLDSELHLTAVKLGSLTSDAGSAGSTADIRSERSLSRENGSRRSFVGSSSMAVKTGTRDTRRAKTSTQLSDRVL